MFTGLVQSVGMINEVELRDAGLCLRIDLGNLQEDAIDIVESISVNGVCLTVTELLGHAFQADVSKETLSRSTISDWKRGTCVNLELALTLSSRLGGHLVSGHVDGLGVLQSCVDEGESTRMHFHAPKNLAVYIAEKGSICIDGVSLTVNRITDPESISGLESQVVGFDVNIVPHTLEVTTLGSNSPGQSVNIEVDLIARYLERLHSKEE